MISQRMMNSSRLCESATGRTRQDGDILVYHSGLKRKIWMSVETRDAGSTKFSVWGMPHNDDGENLPKKHIQLKLSSNGAYATK
uniref:Uncharacterized protein n=1 Tax=Pseudomonas phage Cygsa01 TaxID=3138529 RepID=A0AAU6W4E0_9VIRU